MDFSAKTVKKVVRAAIAAVTRTNDKLELAACAAVMHLQIEGDPCYINQLVTSLNDTSVRCRDLVKWFKHFAPVQVVESKTGKGKEFALDADRRKVFGKVSPEQQVQTMRENPFYKWSPEGDVWKGFSVVTSLERVVKSGTTACKKHEGEEGLDCTEQDLKDIRALLGRINKRRVAEAEAA